MLTYWKISKYQNLILSTPSNFIFSNETYKMVKKQILWIVVRIISLKIRSKFVLKNSVLWKKACFSVSNMNKEVLQRFRFQSFTLKIPRARRSFSKVALTSTSKAARTITIMTTLLFNTILTNKLMKMYLNESMKKRFLILSILQTPLRSRT